MLKFTIRHLLLNKLYSSINIIGLSVGITCILLAVLYWRDERSFDIFHKNNPNLYRITTAIADSKTGAIQTTGETGQVQGPAFKAAVPEVQQYVRLGQSANSINRYQFCCVNRICGQEIL